MRIKPFCLIPLFSLVFFACGEKMVVKPYNEGLHIIPEPERITQQTGEFVLNPNTLFIIDNDTLDAVAGYFKYKIKQPTGYQLADGQEAERNYIRLALDTTLNLKEEGYKLAVLPEGIWVRSQSPQGIFYGMQTVMQLLPAEIESGQVINNIVWAMPCVEIEDEPAYSYRGMMLDVSRHFHDVAFVKKQLDIMAMFKLNRFHWHLTNDHLWTIEIKKYPRLTEIGSIRKETGIGASRTEFDGKPYGGFYTQDEIREIVKYAQERYVTVIPEIDLPGHMLAALAAYPELGCTGGPYEVACHWGVFPDVLCLGNEKTYEFLEGVLSEVIELFPSKYIHIGGDEAPRTRWEMCPKCQGLAKKEGLRTDRKHSTEDRLQSYCMKRIERYLNERGRQIIGWDEILEGDVAPNATVMSWRGIRGGIKAAKLKHDVIMTPNDYMYFDYYQSDDKAQEPLAMGSGVTVEKVYGFEPVATELEKEEKKYILGVQANVWTEYIATPEHVEYMMVPRIAALAEVQWMMPEEKDYQEFLKRLSSLVGFYKRESVNYAKHVLMK